MAEIGNGAKAHICDIRDADLLDAMMEAIWADGPLTGLINNAAANFIAPTKDLSPRGFRAVTSTVMDGSSVTLAAGKRWIAGGHKGSVVSNLVTWVWSGLAFVVPSAMAKTALHAMTMSLAVEWGKYGNIRPDATALGPFPTESAWEKLNPIPDVHPSATGCDTVPMGRYGQMQELQNLIMLLQSDGCDYINGQTIAIDGGQHLAQPGTFADLNGMSDAQWQAAREAIQASTQRDKANRA